MNIDVRPKVMAWYASGTDGARFQATLINRQTVTMRNLNGHCLGTPLSGFENRWTPIPAPQFIDSKSVNENSPLERELMHVINKHSRENGSNTPDFVLGEYLLDCLIAYEKAVKARTLWHQFDDPEEYIRAVASSEAKP